MKEKREHLMREALREAEKSLSEGEVPVGCVIADGGGVIVGRGHNTPISWNDPTAHAEINAIREASGTFGNYRLSGCSAFVTIEPCAMCAGALIQSRIEEVIYGAVDKKGGGVVSQYSIGTDGKLNHSFNVVGGILEEDCRKLIMAFFREKRGI